MSVQCQFLDRAAFREASNKRMALAKQRDQQLADAGLKKDGRYGWARIDEIIPPGSMWYVYWFFDPAKPEDGISRERALTAIADGTFGQEGKNFYLSRYYWQQWSHIRPPICVLCPNGYEWVVDAKSSNGEGWEVKGEPPVLTVTPSIALPGYHGFLGSSGAQPGWFTGDIEGRGPMGEKTGTPWAL